MKIVVGLPSRGRPLEMVASAVSLFRLESGGNEVSVTLAVDLDEIDTAFFAGELARKYPKQIHVAAHARPFGLGELHNAMAAAAPPDAVFMLWSDRVLAISPNWDHDLAVACMQCPNRVLWMDSVHLTGAGQFILPPAWRAAQGEPCPGLYPFWFEDTALEELDAYVHGFPRVNIGSKCAGSRGAKTTRCRDIPFWIDVFGATRAARVRQAGLIAEKFGIPVRDCTAELAYFTIRDREMMSRAPELQRQFGAEGLPDETYLAAKARAMEVLATDVLADMRV